MIDQSISGVDVDVRTSEFIYSRSRSISRVI